MRASSPVPGRRILPTTMATALLALLLGLAGAQAAAASCLWGDDPYTQRFRIGDCTFANVGDNPFFPLVPGSQIRLKGPEDGARIDLWITVLDDTEMVDGVLTRVVEEREWEEGELVEVSRNFFAICAPRNDVFYFGEDVDNYEDGQIVDHEGSWRAGENGARPGIIMPGTFLLDARYYQEIAGEDEALDRACNFRMNRRIWTHAGFRHGCVDTYETTPLEPGEFSLKSYCPGIGLVRDGNVRMTMWLPAAPVE